VSDSKAREAARLAFAMKEVSGVSVPFEAMIDAAIDAYLAALGETHAVVPRELTDALFDAVNDLMPSIFDLQEGIEKHGDDVFYEVFPGPTELWDAMLKAAETPSARG